MMDATSQFAIAVMGARKVWMEENPVEDGRDHVTPFDQFLIATQHPTSTVMALQAEVAAFAEKAFGPDREDAAWKKLFEEIGETLKNPDDPSEWADIFIILLDLATMRGVDVATATRAKIDIIKNRVWVQTSTGTFQHVPGAVKAPPEQRYTNVCSGGPCSALTFFTSCPMDPNWQPDDHEGLGAYVLDRVDRGMDKISRYIWKWDASIEVHHEPD